VIAIREFAPADVPAILRIEHDSHPAGHWRAEDYEWLTRGRDGIVLVAELAEDKAIAGFVAARAMGPEAEMLNLAVASDHRRHGIAGLCPTLVTNGHHALAHGFRTLAEACDADPAVARAVPALHIADISHSSRSDGGRADCRVA